MKTITTLMTVAVMSLFTVVACGQDDPPELPKAQLIDAVSTMGSTCEYRMALTDSLVARLANDPTAQGYVIIYPRSHPVWLAKSRADEIRKTLEMRRFDLSRVTIVKGESQGDAKTEFWIVPMGAESPKLRSFDGVVSGPPVPEITKPKNFTEENPDQCLRGELFLEEYATELSFGYDFPGRIDIYAKSVAAFQKRKRELTAELAKYDIPASRLTFVRKPAVRGEEWVELWILPVKKGAKPNVGLPPGM